MLSLLRRQKKTSRGRERGERGRERKREREREREREGERERERGRDSERGRGVVWGGAKSKGLTMYRLDGWWSSVHLEGSTPIILFTVM